MMITGARRSGKSTVRSTIGLLDDVLGTDYALAVLRGAADAATEQDANLICFPGGVLRDPEGYRAQRNVLFDLVSAENVDGLLIVSGVLGSFIEYRELVTFCNRYRPLPMISIALPLGGIPSVLVDNYAGMHEAAVHLIEVHNYRRIALIRGPEGHQEADDRYRAYTDALTEHGLPLDPDLVVPGDFRPPAGRQAIRVLLDQRKVDLDAVMAANDEMALGALAALHERDLRVPYDVAVMGFDDTQETMSTTPPLTTVRQPTRELGEKATEMVLELLAGREVPEQVVLPAGLVVRQSCGCSDQAVLKAAARPVITARERFEIAFGVQRERILTEMRQAVGAPPGSPSASGLEELLDAFAASMAGESPEVFLITVDTVLRQSLAANVTALQEAVSALRRQTLPWLANDEEALHKAEDLWHQARVMIERMAEQVQIRRALEAQARSATLFEVGQALGTRVDTAELMDAMARELPRLGIRSCYLSLYEKPESPVESSRLIMAYDEGGRIKLEVGGRSFPSRQLAPDGLLSREKRCDLLLEPLYFREDQLGFLLIEAGPQQAETCEWLRGQLSSTLKSVLLFQEREQATEELEEAYASVEKQVEERTAELQRATAERERLQQEIIESQERAIQRVQEVFAASQRTVETSRSGRQSVQDTIDSMARIKTHVESIAESIVALSEQTLQIAEIIASVNDIAAQSSMLALNAAVEAARAGEHGRGFTVVADEVRNLAAQSREATDQVRGILLDIHKSISSTVVVTEEGTKVVDEGLEMAARTEEAIENLIAAIDEAARAVMEMRTGGQQ